MRYLYSEIAQGESTVPANRGGAIATAVTPFSDRCLTAADLSVMSPDWCDRLRQAALQADDQRVLQLLDAIPSSLQALKASLTELVNNFHFDTLLALTQTSD